MISKLPLESLSIPSPFFFFTQISNLNSTFFTLHFKNSFIHNKNKSLFTLSPILGSRSISIPQIFNSFKLLGRSGKVVQPDSNKSNTSSRGGNSLAYSSNPSRVNLNTFRLGGRGGSCPRPHLRYSNSFRPCGYSFIKFDTPLHPYPTYSDSSDSGSTIGLLLLTSTFSRNNFLIFFGISGNSENLQSVKYNISVHVGILTSESSRAPYILYASDILLPFLITHLLTYSLTHLLTYLLTYSLTYLLTFSLTYYVPEPLQFFHFFFTSSAIALSPSYLFHILLLVPSLPCLSSTHEAPHALLQLLGNSVLLASTFQN